MRAQRLTPIKVAEDALFIFRIVALNNGLSNPAYQLHGEVFIVNSRQSKAQHFFGFKQVMQVGNRIVLAGVTAAVRHRSRKIAFKFRASQVKASITSIESAVAPYPGGIYAIKSICPGFYSGKNVVRFAQS